MASDPRKSTEVDGRRVWIFFVVGLSVALLVATAITPFNRPLLRQLDLGVESNLASLWSGLLLLFAGLHAYDGWAAERRAAPWLARAWLVVSVVLVGLSLDEIGSIHERLEIIQGNLQQVLIYSIVGGIVALVGFAVFMLFRSGRYTKSAWLLTGSVLVLATVPLQEAVQTVGLSGPGYHNQLQILIEEATEILAIVMIFLACVENTKGVLDAKNRARYPTFEAIPDMRLLIAVVSIVLGLIFAYVTPQLPQHTFFSQSGKPSAWLAATLFLLSAIAVMRPFLGRRERPTWQNCAFAILSLMACASTVLSAKSLLILAIMALTTGLVLAICLLTPRLDASRYLVVGVTMTLFLGLAWAFHGDAFLGHSMVQFVALGFFLICSQPALTGQGADIEPKAPNLSST